MYHCILNSVFRNFLKLFKANAVLAGAEAAAVEGAFQYGRHIGIAFQLVDDLLDFTSSAEQLGQYFSETVINS